MGMLRSQIRVRVNTHLHCTKQKALALQAELERNLKDIMPCWDPGITCLKEKINVDIYCPDKKTGKEMADKIVMCVLPVMRKQTKLLPDVSLDGRRRIPNPWAVCRAAAKRSAAAGRSWGEDKFERCVLDVKKRIGLDGRMGQDEEPLIEIGGVQILPLVVTGILSAVAGGLGTLFITRLFPTPSPGDGYTVRWFDEQNVERRLDFGDAFREAFERAKALAAKFPIVEVLEISQGRIISIQQAGKKAVKVESEVV